MLFKEIDDDPGVQIDYEFMLPCNLLLLLTYFF